MRHQLAFLGLLLASTCAYAQIYECTDANGKKSFAKECPPDSVKEKEVHPLVVDPGKPVTSPDKLKGLSDAYASQRAAENARGSEGNQREHDAPNAQACADAKARLEAMQTGKQSRRVDPVTGEHVPMDEDARQSLIANLNQEIAKNCR